MATRLLLALLLAMFGCATAGAARTGSGSPSGAGAEIADFNRSFADVTRRMDNAALFALWEDDGVSLLPDTPPIEGKAAIRAFVERVVAQLPGARMQTFELRCSGIEIALDWASEWCDEHQVVAFADGRAPFVGWGRMLLVLHRGAGSAWRLRREMWNAGEGPGHPKG
jgi:ketosteroid isomerase-like protein